MTLREQLQKHPMTWRDYVSAAGVLITIGTMLVQGGRMFEEVKTMNHNLLAMRSQMTSMQTEQIRMATDLERLRGVDAVHEEQLRAARRDLDGVLRARGH